MEIQDQLAVVDAKIKKLQAQMSRRLTRQQILRAEAVEGGFAYYVETIRNTAPSLTWWKEQHPKTWMRYAKEGKVKHFTWK
jgi:sugar (pentulose or hexulose) kinase